MRFKSRHIFILFFFLYVSTQAFAAIKSSQVHLGPREIERIKTFKEMIKGIDDKTVQETAAELEKSRYPLLNLQIKEVMARAYADIVKEEQVVSLKKRQWLYSKVALNMACMQFGGGDESSQGSELDKLILQKLKNYLPAGVIGRKGFHYSLE